MVRVFPQISLLSVGILSNPFNWRKSYQGLKDATLFGLLSDKSAEKLEGENSNNCQFSILAIWLTQSFFMFVFCMQISRVMSLLPHLHTEMCRPGGQYGELIPIFRIFPFECLSTFSRLDNKQGGIL